jgi:CheY-like chemotaxis protein
MCFAAYGYLSGLKRCPKMLLKRKIMVVDDEPDHAEACFRILEREGYQVRSVIGCEALEELMDAVFAFQPDLVFLDHTMPHICDTDAVRMLKANPITKHSRYLFYRSSGYCPFGGNLGDRWAP